MHAAAIIIHGLADGRAAIERWPEANLRSAPGAAGYAGALWWRELIAALRAETGWQGLALLDCGADGALAVEALNGGSVHLILHREAIGAAGIAAVAAAQGGRVWLW